MGLKLSQIFKRERADIKDARNVYAALMKQARRPEFYGEGAVPDSYDGRIDFLTLHMAVVFDALRAHGDTGAKLSQALYDVMIDDFDVALREEGLSDTGVVRRIKPMANLFFERVKAYSDALAGSKIDINTAIKSGYSDDIEAKNLDRLSKYVRSFRESLETISIGEIAQAKFEFPDYSNA